MEGVRLAFGVAKHRGNWDYYDFHRYEYATTKPDGSYEILLETPWIRGMSVEKDGFFRQDRWSDDEAVSYRPGIYNFTLKPTPAVPRWPAPSIAREGLLDDAK